ncbi:hypothetical protein [uncultured Aquimarina sp.]|uniref:hypothetical protein n=1 Tax=uncultured Aquimarina sp. TaxID=575652 RepID=UPI002618D11D|nr:hypothetical protein [uncultured Aquimarina sp.]
MKRILILTILSLTIQYSFGQACGIYRIKYSGNIKAESLKIEKIKLPTIQFLHGLESENSEKMFIEIEPKTNEIDIELVSPLTSHLYEKAENLLKFYTTKNESFPIIIILENETKKEIFTELIWDNIQIIKLEDGKFGNLFEINLNEINIK